jgi:uncharacterized protein with PIN domain
MSNSKGDTVSQHNGTFPVVFDTEPLITWSMGNDGVETVTEFLSDTYHRNINTCISRINLIEVWYVCASMRDPTFGEQKTDDIRDMGVEIVEVVDIWELAARVKYQYMPDFPIGDAFALATAIEREVPLLTGPDSHWDEPIADGHDIIQIP